MKYVLVGYGRMGREIERQADARGHRRAAIVDPAAADRGVRRSIGGAALRGADVAFEFTGGAAAEGNVLALIEQGLPVVCGSTGWKPGAAVRRAAREAGVGVVWAPNFSVGVNLFYEVVRRAAARLGASGLYVPWVVERHHGGKRDAPSGTARRLAEVVRSADPRHPEIHEGHAEGGVPQGSLHVAAVRCGFEPGTHTVGFDSGEDEITLTHRSRGRATFALGAVLAAEWIGGRRGLHGFDRVLQQFLRSEP